MPENGGILAQLSDAMHPALERDRLGGVSGSDRP